MTQFDDNYRIHFFLLSVALLFYTFIDTSEVESTALICGRKPKSCMVVVVKWHHRAIVLFKSPTVWVEIRLATACRAIPCGEWGRQGFFVACSGLPGSRVRRIEKARTVKMKREETFSRSTPHCWFSHDVTKIQTKKLSILPRFYFHDALEQPNRPTHHHIIGMASVKKKKGIKKH